ncbi:helix-turn-helix domain-containing protein [Pseudoroseicyclus aestuarii]|uniref:helix-turn-helix domain-containing protein n=1 Tax=Pseudoroseicyclus aestuarii TaxID=1795041 RepID=UPI000DA23637|nr:helix-turn-helix transcriptional regulator [Pseudoroseicyclus aestuarii]
MTITVICQDTKSVIETKSVTDDDDSMATEKPNPLPEALQSEMRPERIGYRLMLLREALELRPAEIADALGIERTYWSRFEGGKRPITDTTAALLVDRFGVSLDFLILGRWDRLPLELAQKMRVVEQKNR